MEIKTLAHILEELEDEKPASKPKRQKAYNKKSNSNNTKPSLAQKKSAIELLNHSNDSNNLNTNVTYDNNADNRPNKKSSYPINGQHKSHKKPKRAVNKKTKAKSFHPASPYTPKITLDNTSTATPLRTIDIEAIKEVVNENNLNNQANSTTESVTVDNLTDKLKTTLKTDEERQAEREQLKADSRLRWLAFYYLSRREHSASELKDKLIAKEQDPDKIDALLSEFKDKGYQSDYRTAMMLIREGIRKRRGRVRIKQTFYERKVSLPSNIDELIDMAMEESDAFADFVSDNPLVDGVDWLKLAVEARVKKYGNDLPDTPKDKARQLRFLQYRGFRPDICFEALKYTPDSLKDRF